MIKQRVKIKVEPSSVAEARSHDFLYDFLIGLSHHCAGLLPHSSFHSSIFKYTEVHFCTAHCRVMDLGL